MFKRIALGCGVILLLMAGFIGVMLWYGSAELKPHVLGIMELYNEGRYDRIYSNSSNELRAAVPEEKLKATLELIHQNLGNFLEAGGVTGSSREATTAASTATVTVGLKFEKGETSGKFEFVKNEGEWRLLGLTVDLPKKDAAPSPG